MNISASELLPILEGVTIFLLCLSGYFFYIEIIKNRIALRVRLNSITDKDAERIDLENILSHRGLNEKGQLKYPFMRQLNELILRSGLTFSLYQFGAMVTAIMLISFLFGTYLGFGGLLSLSFALLIGLGSPYFVLKFFAARRVDKFSVQLPDAIDMIARSLKVGNPLPVTIRMVGRELPDPIGLEFLITANELSAGRSLPQAIKNLELRVGQEDLSILSAAISIQVETGGNLVEILTLLVNVMRARVKLRRRVNAVSAEGRISGRVLSGLPVAMFIAFNILTPSYYDNAWLDPNSKYILAGCAIWTLVGNFVISKMVDLKV